MKKESRRGQERSPCWTTKVEEKEEVKVYVGIKITWLNKGGIERVIIGGV